MGDLSDGKAAGLAKVAERLVELEAAEERWRSSEQALRDSRRMLQLVLDTIPVRVFWKDRDLVYLGCNRLFALDAGLTSPDELVGRTDYDMGWREQAELYRADDRQVMETGVAKLGYEEPQTTPSGGRIWVRTSKVPLLDADVRVIGVLGTYEDITAQREAQEQRRLLEAQLLHAQKLESLGVLAGGIAHDFNNLLVGIMGNAELAVATLPPDAPAVQFLADLDVATRQAAELCRQMLAYSGRGRFVVEPVNLNRLVSEMAQMLEVALSRRCALRLELASGLPALDADPSQLRQVLVNLVTNAAEACEGRGGEVTVRTGVLETGEVADGAEWEGVPPPGPGVWVEVADPGCGMAPEVRSKLFEPFFSTKFTGRGLGMAVVQGIVRGHRGAITVDSAPGAGTRVRILLPAGDGLAAAPGPTPVAAELRAGGVVLVVDDDDAVRSVAQHMLARLGFDVVAAADGAQALELYRDRRREVVAVLLDLTMPGMDGRDTLLALRRVDPEVGVVLSSGYNEVEVVERFAGVDAVTFVQKPYRLEDLKAALGKVLAGAPRPP